MLNPLMLLGLLGLSVPVLIHLINRRRMKPRQLATLKFLDQQDVANAFAPVPRDLLQLLLRLLLLTAFVLLMARFTGGVPPDLLAQLWGGLDPAARRTARLMGDLALSRRFHLWRETRLVCWLEGRPFLRSCVAQFAGSRAVTTRITGLAPSQPAFWWQHVAVLPLKRFRHLFG